MRDISNDIKKLCLKEWNNVKIQFEKNAEFKLRLNCDLSNDKVLGQNKIKKSKL